MKSTFGGFEAIRKALTASQIGLDVTGQNTANVNTEGYSRQRLDLSSIPSLSGAYKYTPIAVTNVGQGVNINGISRMRDQYIDSRYIKESSNNSNLNTKLTALQDIENIFDEIDTDGLHFRLNDFYDKLQSLSSNPSSVEFTNILRSSAQKLTEVLNQYNEKLQTLHDQRIDQLIIITNDSNSLINKVNNLNKEIKNQLLQGQPSNELMDSRDSYIDKLAQYMNITVENKADGTLSIKSGNTYLLDSQNNIINSISVDSSTIPVQIINNSDGSNFDITNGEIKGDLQILNGMGSNAGVGRDQYRGIPYYEVSISTFAKTFADTFNNLNAFNGVSKPLFEGDSLGNINAASIKLSASWLADSRFVTTTGIDPVVEGRNDNIMRMINAMDQKTSISPTFTGTFEEYATSIMSDVAVDVSYTKDMARTSDLVLSSIMDQRQSVMGVSLDEEAVNMIKYQKSYSAAARLMTTLDEALDTLINRTGLVGR